MVSGTCMFWPKVLFEINNEIVSNNTAAICWKSKISHFVSYLVQAWHSPSKLQCFPKRNKNWISHSFFFNNDIKTKISYFFRRERRLLRFYLVLEIFSPENKYIMWVISKVYFIWLDGQKNQNGGCDVGKKCIKDRRTNPCFFVYSFWKKVKLRAYIFGVRSQPVRYAQTDAHQQLCSFFSPSPLFSLQLLPT